MNAALDLSVPLKVDLAAGPNWLDVESLDASDAAARNPGERRPVMPAAHPLVARPEGPEHRGFFDFAGGNPIACR